jgi:hypothetical protein
MEGVSESTVRCQSDALGRVGICALTQKALKVF